MSETRIANLALYRIGADTIEDIENPDTPNGWRCNQMYPQTRDALLRSHWWRFATDRATLSEDTTAPDFEWDNQFDLPNDFMRMKELYDSTNSYSLEGKKLLTNDDTAEIVYIKRVTDPTQFDSLFTEVLVLQLAVRLATTITGGRLLSRELNGELAPLMARARTIDRQETHTTGRADRPTWVGAHNGSGKVTTSIEEER